MYTDEEIINALATNNHELLEIFAVYTLLKSQNIKFDISDIKAVPQDDPRRLDVTYRDCNFQIKEIMNLQEDCLLENRNGYEGKWSQPNIGVYKRGEIYKKIKSRESPIGEVTDAVWFDLGLAIKNKVDKAIDLYSDVAVRRNMDLFLLVTQPRTCLGSLELIKKQLQLTGFRSIIALIHDTKYVNIAQSNNTPATIKQFNE